MNAPLRFQPHLRPLVWGGRRLGEALARELPGPGPYGESWEVSDHSSHRSVVADGPYAGRTLRDLMEADPAALLGPAAGAHSSFPWLVKYLDARDWLSVQVHPDDAAASRLWPGEGGKTEAWFVLAAEPDSRVYAGLLPGVDEPALRAAVARGTVTECLHQFRPRPGDCVFLPAGTVHAVGGGVLFAEVQQTSDATFRLYDWDRRDAAGRPRELHVEPGLACIDWQTGSIQPVRAAGFPDTPDGLPESAEQRLVACPYFTLDYRCSSAPFAVGGTGALQVVLPVYGKGRLDTALGRQAVRAGDTLVLPAVLPALTCVPDGPLALLIATLPASDGDTPGCAALHPGLY